MRYNGPYDSNEIGKFIVEVSRKLQNKDNTNNNNEKIRHDPKEGIPAYTIGHPLCGPDDKVCYLEFDEAYGNNNTGNQHSRPRQQLPAGSGMIR